MGFRGRLDPMRDLPRRTRDFTTEDTEDTEKNAHWFSVPSVSSAVKMPCPPSQKPPVLCGEIGSFVHDSHDSIAKPPLVKVDEQSDVPATELQVRQELRVVDGEQFRDGLRLDDDHLLDQ